MFAGGDSVVTVILTSVAFSVTVVTGFRSHPAYSTAISNERSLGPACTRDQLMDARVHTVSAALVTDAPLARAAVIKIIRTARCMAVLSPSDHALSSAEENSKAGLVLIWLLSIGGVVLLFATTGVLHYLGLGLILASSIVSIRHSLRLRAFAHERSQDQEPQG